MSAITGIFYRDGRTVQEEQIKKMNERLSHRGPDGSAVWCEGSVAFGHQMLYTTPESLHEKLPYEEDGLIITADARIDNRKELSEKLDLEDKEEVSDSYFILKTYQKWGEKCPEELLGDFAFAIWDKDKKKLFCARDHMGVKPFYYYLDDEVFYFGTEIKAILNMPNVPYELNERKLALFLMKDTLDKELTFYEDIKCLPSANSLKIYKHEYVFLRYWKLNPDSMMMMDSEEDYARAFREIFAEAVKSRLRSYYPIGFELSGGLDSSSIVCMAKKIFTENNNINLTPLNTFSRIYNEVPESDERYYIKKVLNDGGFSSNFINGANISPLENIITILKQQDQPFYTPHITKQSNTLREMSKNRIRILLSGEGGDQIVSHGNNYLRELAVTFHWKSFIRELNGHSNNYHESKYKIILEKVIFPSLPNYVKRFTGILINKDSNSILNKSFLKNMKIDEINSYDFDNLTKITCKKYHYHIINNNTLHETIFETIDKNASNFCIEVRYPFYDKRLIEFCYSLPSDMKLKYGWSRYILRIAMEKILPVEIQWRLKKTDLSPTYERSLLLYEKETLKEIISENNEVISKYINLKKIKNILKNYKPGNDELFDIWLVSVVYYWLENL